MVMRRAERVAGRRWSATGTRRGMGLLISAILLLLPVPGPAAEGGWVEISLADGSTRKAYMSTPSGDGPHPGLVYMHGTVVRERGYDGAAAQGYDIARFARQFSDLGFVALAPLRETPKGCCNGDAAIAEGLSVAAAAAAHMRSFPGVDGNRICLVGFSEGGLISLWSVARHDDFSAAVIMSAASMGGKRARAETMSARHLGRAGVVRGISEPLHFTVGDNEHKSVRRGAQRFSEQAGADLTVLPGDHKSFTAPRTDVAEVVKSRCR